MQHQPSYSHIRVSETLEQSFDVFKHVVLLQLTVSHITFEPLEAVLDHKRVFFSNGFDICEVDIVLNCLLGCWEVLPVLSDVYKVSLVNLNHKVVREVFIRNLTHLGLLVLQNSWCET